MKIWQIVAPPSGENIPSGTAIWKIYNRLKLQTISAFRKIPLRRRCDNLPRLGSCDSMVKDSYSSFQHSSRNFQIKEKTMFIRNLTHATMPIVLLSLLLSITMISTSQGSQDPAAGPQEITADLACGKCAMFPAQYPQWQAQVVFNDGKMTPFDGGKCMFGFLFTMSESAQGHSTDDIAAVWVREFNTGDWIDGKGAHYVVGSDKMGPMGKELIPFGDAASAERFQKEHGGQIARYDAITMETLKPLMGKMHMKGKMDM